MTVIDFALFFGAICFGIVAFSHIALPILYGVPQATWWALRGRLKWRAIPLYLLWPVVWSFLFVGGAMLIEHFTPNVVWGWWLGIIISAFIRTVGVASARKVLNEDFLDFVRPYLTSRGRDLVPVAAASILAPDRLKMDRNEIAAAMIAGGGFLLFEQLTASRIVYGLALFGGAFLVVAGLGLHWASR